MEWLGLSWWFSLGVVLIALILYTANILCAFSRWYWLPSDDEDASERYRHQCLGKGKSEAPFDITLKKKNC
ncbi:hypothetical protein [Propionispora hippei]|uniref:Uncharacterized protein n=1 Tax=Propionispora hippei DSM 15287 TaxID=1123003 RepID=A0A1M6MBR9_9FIRM|nr:hypothetical protein [Propionispora hippei]SHJ80899.1 hypothetical protein SAMN02745170_03387 [Propionispora hippei DSM 15287]